MLLLGPVLHAGLSFMQFPLGESWEYKHKETALFFDAMVLFIHLFRVPIFFVLAGFFMETNISLKPLKVILKKKLIRIGLPLIFGVLLLFPIVDFGMAYSNNLAFSIQDYRNLWRISHYNTMHLWFLYYLLFFYLAHLILSTQMSVIRKEINHLKYANLWIILLFFILLGLSLLSFVNPKSFDGDYSFLPNLGTVLYFLSFYILGIILFHINDFFVGVKKHYIRYLTLGSILFSILLFSRSTAQIDANFTFFENLFFISAVYVFIIGFLGLFSKIFTKKNKQVQYLSKSSYFIYVVHLPILVWLLSLLSKYQLEIYSMFSAVLVLTLFFSYGLYELIRLFRKKN